MSTRQRRRKKSINNCDGDGSDTPTAKPTASSNRNGISQKQHHNHDPRESATTNTTIATTIMLLLLQPLALFFVLVFTIAIVLLFNFDYFTPNSNQHQHTEQIEQQQQKLQQPQQHNTIKKKQPTTVGTYKLLQTIPHDPNAFTQGLSLIHDSNSHDDNENSPSYLLEGTGMNGQSTLRLIDIQTNNGTVLQKYNLPKKYFGEGITPFYYYPNGYKNTNINHNTNGSINYTQQRELHVMQITWQDQIAFIYNLTSPTTSVPLEVSNNTTIASTINATSTPLNIHITAPIHNFTFHTTTKEGWGITYNPQQHLFYVTDGSNHILTWDANTYEQIQIQPVLYYKQNQVDNDDDDGIPLHYLNEIEYEPKTQTILANIWYQDYIARIDPITGIVQTLYDISSLYVNRAYNTDCFNGIALSSSNTHSNNTEIWVTGKNWPHMYRIELIDDPTRVMK